MTPEQILSYAPRVLTQSQREHYFEHGYVGVESLVPADTLAEVQAVTNEFVELSRKETQSGEAFDIGPGHSAETPVLRRIKSPDERHEVYWNFATGLMADVAADLVGPNVTYHHSKLNFKWFDESDTVKWHQDIQFFPHTNYNVLSKQCADKNTSVTSDITQSTRKSNYKMVVGKTHAAAATRSWVMIIPPSCSAVLGWNTVSANSGVKSESSSILVSR